VEEAVDVMVLSDEDALPDVELLPDVEAELLEETVEEAAADEALEIPPVKAN